MASGGILFKLLDGATQVQLLRDANALDTGFDSSSGIGYIPQAVVIDGSGNVSVVRKDRLSNDQNDQGAGPAAVYNSTSGTVWNP